MQLHMLNWNGNIMPAELLPSLREIMKPVCISLVHSGQVGSETILPPAYLLLVSGTGENTSEREEVEWRMKLLSTEAGIGGIYGCSFRMAATFQGKPVQMDFLVPHQYFPKKDEGIWN